MRTRLLSLPLVGVLVALALVLGWPSATAQGPDPTLTPRQPSSGTHQGPPLGPTPVPKPKSSTQKRPSAPEDPRAPLLNTPARFAEAYSDRSNGAMSLYFMDENGRTSVNVSATGTNGYSPSLAMKPGGGFVYLWDADRCIGSCTTLTLTELYYTLLDHAGGTSKAITKLTDLTGSAVTAADRSPAVAVTPDGHIGILWLREVKYSSTKYVDNIVLTILDAAGNTVLAPYPLTYNVATGTTPYLWTPQIAATSDNRFVVAWGQAAAPVGDVWYAVFDSVGGIVLGGTKITTDGNNILHSANRTAANNAILTWWCNWDLCYSVVNSSGGVVRGRTNLTNNTQVRWSSDAAMLADGNTVIAWIDYDDTFQQLDQLAFAVLDTSFNPIVGPIPLYNPISKSGNTGISVAPDISGQAILSWTDASASPYTLFYSLVDKDGYALVPQLFGASSTSMQTSLIGYANSLYSNALAAGVDGWVSVPAAATAPGGSVTIHVTRGNKGYTTATGVTLSAALDPALNYLGNSLGIAPSVNGHTYTWNLPAMGFFDPQQFAIAVGTPAGGSGGTHYPVTWTLSSAGPEANAADNTVTADVVLLSSVYLPFVRR